MKKFILTAFILLNITQVAYAHREPQPPTEDVNNNLPILVIGASFGNGSTAFDSGTSSPLLGLAVAGGNYLSLGDALVRDPSHNGFVVNEAQAGSTTFANPSCRLALYGGACSTAKSSSFEEQLVRAASRVRSLATGAYNAEYVIITSPNDCLHSDAFGVPETDAVACDVDDMQDVADRLVDVGRLAISLGLTPVFVDYPPVDSVDLVAFQQNSLLLWTISESDYQLLNDTVMATIAADLPEALIINYWEEYEQLGDGIHPTPATTQNAASIILNAIGYAQDVSNASCKSKKDNHGRGHH